MNKWTNLFVKYIYVDVVVKMSAEGGVSDEVNTRASNSIVQRYESLDEKVELLIERMSECLRLVNEYMESIRMVDGEYHYGRKQPFLLMLKQFPVDIENLKANQRELKRGNLLLVWKLKYERAKILKTACTNINSFHNNHWTDTNTTELSHVRNEMQNLYRIYQNLHPEVRNGFTKLNTQGVLIKEYREDTQDYGIVSELAWKKVCVVCLHRDRDVVLYPCTHFCLCRQCSESVGKCPLCREPIKESVDFGIVERKRLPYIVCTQFPGPERYVRRLLTELQALG